jgi:ketosteroid isomerase-like protein
MSEENAEVIKSAYAAWHREGLDAFAEYWAEDTRWRSIQGAPDDRGPMHGRAVVRAYIEDWLETFDDFRVDLVELIDVGKGQVVATLSYSGRTKHSDVKLPGTPFAAVFVVRDGRIVDGGEYETVEEALEAARVSE